MGWAHRMFSFESAGQLEAWFLARKWLEFNSLSQIKGVNKLANAYLFFARLNFGISLISMRPRRLYRNLFSCKSPMMHGKSSAHSPYLHLMSQKYTLEKVGISTLPFLPNGLKNVYYFRRYQTLYLFDSDVPYDTILLNV